METRVDVGRAVHLGIPEVVVGALRQEGYQASRPAISAALEFAGEEVRSVLFLAGPPGTGKSVAAAVGALACRTRAKLVRVEMPADESVPGAVKSKVNGDWYVTMPMTLGGEPLNGRWVNGRQFFHSIFNELFWKQLEATPLLVVDDLGAEVQDEKVRTAFVAMLVERMDRMRKTLLTTNLTLDAFAQSYGQVAGGARLIDRLDGRAWMTVGGGSLR